MHKYTRIRQITVIRVLKQQMAVRVVSFKVPILQFIENELNVYKCAKTNSFNFVQKGLGKTI